jgi:GT2 family glycosyltransferase
MVEPSNRASVVIACFTLERWLHLSAAIDSALDQTEPPDEVIVVVDHNDELRRKVSAAWPEVRVLENRFGVGASGARNTGAFTVSSPIVAFLDDDAVAGPRWLELLLEHFRDPSVVGVGGGVTASWEQPKPGWFPDEFGWVLGVSFPGMPVSVSETRNVWAENMAVRRNRFVEVEGFRLNFGKVGSHSSPEDTDLCIRMAGDGGRWLYVPEAQVAHHVPGARATFKYFMRRSYHEGEGKAALASLSPAKALGLERHYTTRLLPRAFVRGLRKALAERRRAPAAQSGAILVGILCAGAGYARERMRLVP